MGKQTETTRDDDIRRVLRAFIDDEHAGQPDTIVLEEFALFGGKTRADLAVLNGLSHGYEIKSHRDSLERLPKQVTAYSAVFEHVTFVGVERHLNIAQDLVPSWWGLVLATVTASGVELVRVRQSAPNPSPQPWAIAALLWRGEALSILESLGLATGVRSKPMPKLMERLVECVPVEVLASVVRQTLRAREGWLTAPQQTRCGGSRQPSPKSLHFPSIS